MTTPVEKVGGSVADYLDERVSIGKAGKGLLRKVFPDHWSFMLGEIALYSFIILLLSGTFLTLFFQPSMQPVIYHGSYAPLDGVRMSQAYQSTINLSFDVRGGLLMRQVHHWAALVFVAAIMMHMLRIFFTGAFRKPRELNWLIGLTLLMTGMVEGFLGYSLPDDLLSGTGLRILEGVFLSIPIVGTYITFFIFGGQFPGTDLIPRLFTVHILLLPGLILALITVHLFLVFYQKHTQWPGAGKTNENVIGLPLMPVYMAKAGGFFFLVFGVTALMGGLVQINPIWMYGPYTPDQISADAQPDFYMGWLEGGLRMMPNWEIDLWGHTLSLNVLVPGLLVLGLLFTILGVYPFIESWLTKDKREHHLLDRPRNAPTRTALGVGGVVAYGVLWLAGSSDLLATHLSLSVEDITWTMRGLFLAGPVIGFFITKRMCLGLQRKDREKVLHGRETGIIKRLPHGEYIEVHEPLAPVQRYVLTAHETPRPIEAGELVDENGVPRPGARMARMRARLSQWFYKDHVEKPTAREFREIMQAHGHGDGAHEVDGVSERAAVEERSGSTAGPNH